MIYNVCYINSLLVLVKERQDVLTACHGSQAESSLGSIK